MQEIELTDATADRCLLDAEGLTLLVFHSQTCGSCRKAREQLPKMRLSVQRIAWVDAGQHGGLVARYEVFYLPAMYLVRDGTYYGSIQASLQQWDIERQIHLAQDSYPAVLP